SHRVRWAAGAFPCNAGLAARAATPALAAVQRIGLGIDAAPITVHERRAIVKGTAARRTPLQRIARVAAGATIGLVSRIDAGEVRRRTDLSISGARDWIRRHSLLSDVQ